MNDTLITLSDFKHPWQAMARALGLSLLAGLMAFGLTWAVLAWPTLMSELNWYLHPHSAVTLQPATGQTIPTIEANHLVIPAISVDAPVIYDTQFTDAVGKLPDGVVHVEGTAHPGDAGNTFIIGHSSGYWWQQGKYNQVFALLDKVKVGDQILVDRNGVTVEYHVSSTEIVSPAKVSELDQPSTRHELSLMTCTPVGTSLNRFIVHADQANPVVSESALPTNIITALH